MNVTQPINKKAEQAKQYLLERGILQPRVRIGVLHNRPMRMQRQITEEESQVQDWLLSCKQ
jgi:hypothetical protein